jgi:hypothetical protein
MCDVLLLYGVIMRDSPRAEITHSRDSGIISLGDSGVT